MHFYENFNLSDNLANLSENEEQVNKVKAKEVEVWNQKKIVFKCLCKRSSLRFHGRNEFNLLGLCGY